MSVDNQLFTSIDHFHECGMTLLLLFNGFIDIGVMFDALVKVFHCFFNVHVVVLIVRTSYFHVKDVGFYQMLIVTNTFQVNAFKTILDDNNIIQL